MWSVNYLLLKRKPIKRDTWVFIAERSGYSQKILSNWCLQPWDSWFWAGAKKTEWIELCIRSYYTCSHERAVQPYYWKRTVNQCKRFFSLQIIFYLVFFLFWENINFIALMTNKPTAIKRPKNINSFIREIHRTCVLKF